MSDAGFVGSIPQHYDAGLGPIIFADPAADMARRVGALKPKRVLETAAGTGIATRAIRDALPPDSELVVTDLNMPMLDIARLRFRTEEKIRFEAADATALPFQDGAFDLVSCQFGVMFYPDKDLGYREIKRLLQPGGHYLFSVWDSHKYNANGRLAYELVGRFFDADPPQFLKVPFSYPLDAIKDSLLAAGFGDISVDVCRHIKPVPDPAQLARGIIFGTPVFEQIQSRGGVDPEAIVTALTKAYADEFSDGTMLLQWLVISARA